MRSNPAELHTAIIFKNFEAVIDIVDSGVTLDKLWRGLTPVSCAIYEKTYNILEYLVAKGADVNIRTHDNKMEPPLFAACRLVRMEAVRILLQSPNLNIDQRDFFNRTPLWAAARSSSLELVQLLLDHGADINAAEDGVECPLIQSLLVPQRDPNINIAHLLIRRGCKLDLKGRNDTPLSWSVKHEDLVTFTILVKAGCKIGKTDWLVRDKLPTDWKNDEFLCQWISTLQNGPPTLIHLSSCLVRKTLVQNQKNIFPNHVRELPLPNHLIRLILLEN